MSDDWATRSAGAVKAVRMNTSGDVDTYRWQSGASNYSFDATLEAPKLTHQSAESEQSVPALVIQFGGSYGNGNTYWISFRVRVDAMMAYYDFETDDASRPRPKVAIISRADGNGNNNTLGSNPANGETVIERTRGNGLPHGYYYDSPGSITNTEASYTSVNGATFRTQRTVDVGRSPLTGNNPTSGAAWTAEEQEQARYGGLLDSETAAGEFAYGIGDVLTGGLRMVHDTWITITCRYVIGAFGSANSRWTTWAAYDGEPYRLLWDSQNITLGSAAAGNHTGIWLTPYQTHGATGGARISANDTNITGVTYHCCGRDTPSGVGVLSYNATTQKFTWHGNGQSDGTAIGFSSDIDGLGKTKLTFRVPASGAGNHGSSVVITVNPATLPASGTTTDNVTIATDGRANASVWYKDFIESLSPINAPGGYAPTTVLEEAARDLPANTWREVVSANISSVFYTAGAGATSQMSPYASRIAYDELGKKAIGIYQDHQPGIGPRMAVYDEDTNSWTRYGCPNIISDSDGAYHGYHKNFIEKDTRIFHYGKNNDSSIVMCSLDLSTNPDLITGWGANSAGDTSGPNWYDAWEWFPDLTGGAAAVRFSTLNGVVRRLRGGSWATLGTISGVSFALNSAAGYSKVKQVLVCYVQPDGAADLIAKVTAAGTVSTLTEPPIAVTTDASGWICDDPVTGNFVVMKGRSAANSQIYDLDPDGSGTWTEITNSVNMPAMNNWLNAADTHRTYGVIFVAANQIGVQNSTIYLYKRTAAAGGGQSYRRGGSLSAGGLG